MSSDLPPLRPTLNFDPELLLRAQPVRVVFFGGIVEEAK